MHEHENLSTKQEKGVGSFNSVPRVSPVLVFDERRFILKNVLRQCWASASNYWVFVHLCACIVGLCLQNE